jgi:hypothetical protein
VNTITFSYYARPSYDTVKVDVVIAPIGKLVPLHAFDARWAMFFGDELHGYDTFLPTEMLVRKPELVQPRRGRIFKTGLHLRKGFAMSYEELLAHYARLGEQFPGTYVCEDVVLVEVYAHGGDDGHTDYRLVGYRFVGEKALEARNEWKGTMDVMIDNMPGDHE